VSREQGRVSVGRGRARRGARMVRPRTRTTGAARRSGEAPARSEHGECERRRESVRSEREGAWAVRGRELDRPTYRARGERRGHRGEGRRSNGWPSMALMAAAMVSSING
jgi:hypothetical protein